MASNEVCAVLLSYTHIDSLFLEQRKRKHIGYAAQIHRHTYLFANKCVHFYKQRIVQVYKLIDLRSITKKFT